MTPSVTTDVNGVIHTDAAHHGSRLQPSILGLHVRGPSSGQDGPEVVLEVEMRLS